VDPDREWDRDRFDELFDAIRDERTRRDTGDDDYQRLSGRITKLKAYGEFRSAGNGREIGSEAAPHDDRKRREENG